MTAITKHDYDYLKKNTLLDKNNYSNSEQNILVLKQQYVNQINSARRFSEINTLEQLIDVLEKRDCVSENDITILEEIAKETGNHQFLAMMNTIRIKENRAGERDLCPTPTAININPKTNVQLIPGVTNFVHSYDKFDIKLKVYDVITAKIGNKWIDFARALNVVESKIDNLKIIYSNNSELCVREVLDYHERNVHPREFKTLLLQALEKARRNDLKNEVIRIYDAYR